MSIFVRSISLISMRFNFFSNSKHAIAVVDSPHRTLIQTNKIIFSSFSRLPLLPIQISHPTNERISKYVYEFYFVIFFPLFGCRCHYQCHQWHCQHTETINTRTIRNHRFRFEFILSIRSFCVSTVFPIFYFPNVVQQNAKPLWQRRRDDVLPKKI